MLEKLFKLSENKTDVKTEVLAGVTTFMTMAYILAVNPSIPVSYTHLVRLWCTAFFPPVQENILADISS